MVLIYLASHLNSPLYYKQIEYYDKKGNKKTKKDESSAPIHYSKLTYSEKSNNQNTLIGFNKRK